MAAERDELKALVDSMRSKSTGMGRLFSFQRRNTRKIRRNGKRRGEKRREEKRGEEERREEKRRNNHKN